MKYIQIQVSLSEHWFLFGVGCTTCQTPAPLTSSPWAGTGWLAQTADAHPGWGFPSCSILLPSRTFPGSLSACHTPGQECQQLLFSLTHPFVPAVFRILVSQILDRTEPVLYSTMSSEIITVFQYYNYFASHSVNDLGSYLLQLAKEGRVYKI